MANENYRNDLSQAASALLRQLRESDGDDEQFQLAEFVLGEFGKTAARYVLDDEREICAKIAEGYANLHIESHPCHIQAKKTAAKIRARMLSKEKEETVNG